jgi:hypothetical protein
VSDFAKEAFADQDGREGERIVELVSQAEDAAEWERNLNHNVDSLIIKLCHSDTNFTTLQFE